MQVLRLDAQAECIRLLLHGVAPMSLTEQRDMAL